MRNIKPVLFVTVLFIITVLAYGAVYYQAEAQTLSNWDQNFDSFSTGDLKGQGLWATSTIFGITPSTNWDVSGTEYVSGAFSIKNTANSGGDAFLDTGFDISTGGTKIYKINWFPTGSITTTNYRFHDSATTSQNVYIEIRQHASSNKLYVGTNADPSMASTTGNWILEQWNTLEIEFNFDLNIVRARTNNGAWTDYVFSDLPTMPVNELWIQKASQTAGHGVYIDNIGFSYNSENPTSILTNVVSFAKQVFPKLPYDLTSSSTIGFHTQYFFIDDTTGTVQLSVYDNSTNALVYTDSTSTVFSTNTFDWYSTTTLETGKRYYWKTTIKNSAGVVLKNSPYATFDVIVPVLDETGGYNESILELIDAGSSTSTQQGIISGFFTNIGRVLAQKHPFAWMVDIATLFTDLRQDSSTTTIQAGINFSEIDYATSSNLATLIGTSTEFDITLFDSETMFDLIPENVIGGLRVLLTAVLWVGLAMNIYNRTRNIV